ncbi:PadR family transcriptional regulator [Xylanibacillus composti]|uniref:PadR family transcriptional regulator n=1 Tax=Xylanibacillus composti TaxID=1572762 RepID=A0A8J4M2U7_9BACL|nr:PadR family transcriptional regulator [Xylanibacillus composti]MDT9724311.1 PadR family transcriptional regulator [Xylanibacillus composti]GIQ69307.1 PadR family transcriptional regulator [Xylanibacillus composti]
MNRDKQLPLTETTYYILLALVEPAHGYLIMQKVEELSHGQVKLAAGTLYGAIENLLKHQWIAAVKSDEKRRKTYVITEKGIAILRLDYERMQHMLAITDRILQL